MFPKKKVKIELGQVWQREGLSNTYTITQIVLSIDSLGTIKGTAWALNSHTDALTVFIYTDAAHLASINEDWNIICCNTKTRECPCGIYRGDCDYHKA